MYNNYLLNIAQILPGSTVTANDARGFLGVDIEYKGIKFYAHVDGYKVSMNEAETGKGYRGFKKSPFTVAKKETTNAAHAEEIKNYMRMCLAAAKKYQAAADLV